jgi:hypothetical protein
VLFFALEVFPSPGNEGDKERVAELGAIIPSGNIGMIGI